mmetsp:Transcript_30790/g.60068  ORF Transcript_30790/g.60068 Transcript_30790/m.60068 type:complete len:242 (-) Transcript_30790:1394-2119(-)
MVLVPWQHRSIVKPDGLADVCVGVVEVVVVVPSKIVFHAVTPVDEKVVVGLVVGRSVVIVYVLLWRVVVNEEVVVDLSPLRSHAGSTIPNGGQKRLAVPRVEGPVVSALAACREHQVVADLIPSAEPIVSVDASTGPVEKHVPCDLGLSCFGLHIETALFFVQTYLPGCVACHSGVARVVAVSAVHSGLWVVDSTGLIGEAPRSHSIPADVREVRVLDRCEPIVARHHHPVAVQAVEHTLV